VNFYQNVDLCPLGSIFYDWLTLLLDCLETRFTFSYFERKAKTFNDKYIQLNKNIYNPNKQKSLHILF